MKLKNQNGLTLVEVLIAVFLLSVGIVSTLMFFSNAMLSAEFAGDITVASTHAEFILEEMKSRKTLSNVTATDWAEWARNAGLPSLPGETVEVFFTNAESDPLEVMATVSWKKKLRNNKVVFITGLTK